MNEFRRHPHWCPRGHPDGVYRLDVFFDFGAFPVWGRFEGGRPARTLYGSITPPYLGITSQLAHDLQAWADWRDRHGEYGGRQSAGAGEREAHVAQGRELADRLAAETGAVVVYGKSLRRNNPPDCPHCGTAAAEV